jgi:hypothetical protein
MAGFEHPYLLTRAGAPEKTDREGETPQKRGASWLA